MRLRFGISAIAVLAVGFSLSACGGDNNSLPETPVTTPDTPASTGAGASLVSQGDSVCAETNTAVGAIQASESDPSTELSQVADLYDGMVSKLKDLDGASADAALQPVLDAGDNLVQAERDAQLAAERGADTSSAESDASSAFDAFASAAQSYGFHECGQPPEAPSSTGSGDTGTTVTPVVPTTTVPVTPTTTVPVTPVTPVTPAPVAPVTPTPTPVPGGGTAGGGGTVTPPSGGGSSGGGSSGGIGPG